MTEDERIPTGVWVEAQLRALTAEGRSYYVVQKGAYAAGTVLVKINAFEKGCMVLIQQRDLEGNLGWSPVLGETPVEEAKADDYIKRAISRDPDLWAIEVEDRESRNPFDDKSI